MKERLFKKILTDLPVWLVRAIEDRAKDHFPKLNRYYYWMNSRPMEKWTLETLKDFGQILGFDFKQVHDLEILGVKIVPNTEPELYRLVATGGGKYLGASSIAFAQDGTVVSVADLDTTSPAALEAVRFIHE